MAIKSVCQVRVATQGALPSLIGNRQDEGQGDGIERECRGAWYSSKHIADAIMDNAVNSKMASALARAPAPAPASR